MLKPLLKAAYYVEQGLDKVRWSYLRKFNLIGPLMIVPYHGLGNAKKAYISGRLIVDRNIRPAREDDSKWRNLRAMYKRFESQEIPEARIQADFYGLSYETKTDKNGFFEFELSIPADIDRSLLWHPVALSLRDQIGNNKDTVQAAGKVLIPHDQAEYGIISDIDDTVLLTKATNYIRMMQKTFLYNAQTRLPFEGVSAFYRALHMGSNDSSIRNPLYYVSSSPWNLYDMLEDFFEMQGIPAGPLMLRDLQLDLKKLFASAHKTHKLNQIEKIFKYTGELPFILIGDSGQKDPEIYQEVVRRHPGRILAIYIRDVSKEHRDKQVYQIMDETLSLGAEMLFVKDTEAAARHAIGQGYIRPVELDDVQEAKARDKEPEDQAS
jgi:phosphatidate phosphatase APP1